jgi:hypothetical protein
MKKEDGCNLTKVKKNIPPGGLPMTGNYTKATMKAAIPSRKTVAPRIWRSAFAQLQLVAGLVAAMIVLVVAFQTGDFGTVKEKVNVIRSLSRWQELIQTKP